MKTWRERRARWLAHTALLGGLLCLTASAEAREQHGSTTENPRWGYKIRAPKNWKSRAIQLSERWIAGKYFPSYPLRARNEQGEFIQHTPDLWVIGFPHAREDERRKVERPDENTTIITIRNPYKDYKDFVKRESWASTGSGGWYYEREESTTHAGHRVDVYEIKVEKLVRAPLRIVTWVYHCKDVDFAVQVRILEEHYAENKGVIEGALKSFREIPRTEPFPEDPEAEPEDPKVTLSLEEINAKRRAMVEQRIEREIKNLGSDWRVTSSKHFVILAPRDKRYSNPVRYVMNFAKSLRAYLEDHFEDIGPAEVPRGIIRVFATQAEEQAYRQGTRGWWADEVGEITMTYSAETSLLGEFSWVAQRLTDQYFHIKNENLRAGMPGWIRTGIWGHIGWARPSKRKKMILQPTPHDIVEVRRMIASGSQLPLKELMTVSGEDVLPAHHAQARSVVYWLLGRGDRGKVKGAMAKYLGSIEQIIVEEDANFEAAEARRMQEEMDARSEEDAKEKTQEELEAEEDEQFRKRRQNRSTFNSGLEAKYAAIRARAQQAAFGHLTDDDWEKLDRRWKKFANG